MLLVAAKTVSENAMMSAIITESSNISRRETLLCKFKKIPPLLSTKILNILKQLYIMIIEMPELVKSYHMIYTKQPLNFHPCPIE